MDNGVMSPRRRNRAVIVLLSVVVLLAACSGDGDLEADEPTSTTSRSDGGPSTTTDVEITDTVRVEVLSSQPDRIGGDDARIRITPSSTGSVDALIVDLDGRIVTDRFEAADGQLEGVLDGIVEGTNSLTVTGDGDPVTLRLRAWPLQGPMFSGAQIPLPACSTEAAGLGPAGPDCEADRTISFRYLTQDGRLSPLDDTDAEPDDLATVELDGESVPGIVRVERGVINRSLYEFSVLVREPDQDPDAIVHPVGSPGLVLRFGDGCGATHGQGELRESGIDAGLVEAGYVVATATFLDGAVTCNDVVAAETAAMVKERVIEAVGVPRLTVGFGRGLGGGQVHLLAQTYPDVLDAGVTVAAFPDVVSFANEIADCRLLRSWFDGGGSDLTPEQRQAITGHGSAGTCGEIADRHGDPFDPTAGCDPTIPAELRYGPGRPGGIRCTMQDMSAVVFGDDAATGAPARPIDNVGVQYGLRALDDGRLSMGEFLDLNDRIGGLGPDGEFTGERMAIDEQAVEPFYETGRISQGAGHQGSMPFVDVVAVDPGDDPGDLHRALAFRDRIERVVGRRSLQQIWALRELGPARYVDAVVAVDDWWSTGPLEPTDVPDTVVSRCELDDGSEERGIDVFRLDGEDCLEDPPPADPRIVAGAWSTGDIVKCSLKPIDPLDYPDQPTDEQWERLRRIFPDGVCDWNAAGTGQMLPSSPDRSFDEVETPADLA